MRENDQIPSTSSNYFCHLLKHVTSLFYSQLAQFRQHDIMSREQVGCGVREFWVLIFGFCYLLTV